MDDASKRWAGLTTSAALLLGLVATPSAGQETVTLFVTSLKADAVHVFQGRVPDLKWVQAIPVGREPHNLGISPDGRRVATGGRRSGEVSVIDASALREITRIRVGRQPHDLVFSSDSRTLFVSQEQEPFVSVIDLEARATRGRIPLGRAQHDLALTPDERELWFTVTNRPYTPGDRRVGVVELAAGKVTLIDTEANAHDVILSPDGRVAWVTNSGFVDRPDDRVHHVDVATRRVLGVLTLVTYQRLSQAAVVESRPALIVWPETAVPFSLQADRRRDAVLIVARAVQAPLLVGAPHVDRATNRAYNSAFLINSTGAVTDRYDKVHLVPFGEYVPLRRLLFFADWFVTGGIGEFSPGEAVRLFQSPAGRFGVTICYEAIFPEQVRLAFADGADFLVNITNDAWFRRTAAPYQHLAMAAVRAVENRAYVVRAANTGISAIVAPDGRIVRASGLFTREIVAGFVAPRQGTTFYTRYGDVFARGTLWAVLLATGAVSLSRVRWATEIPSRSGEPGSVRHDAG